MSRLARLRPALKIGKVSVGTKLQARVPASNNLERLLLDEPVDAVRLMLGKNAARAAPILALAARKLRSASRMSGRRCSNCDGKPAGTLANTLPSTLALSGNACGSNSTGTCVPTSSTRALRSCATWAV